MKHIGVQSVICNVAEGNIYMLSHCLDSCVQGFPPMNKYGLQMVIKLASCYGLKASAQGSGKKQASKEKLQTSNMKLYVAWWQVLHHSFV